MNRDVMFYWFLINTIQIIRFVVARIGIICKAMGSEGGVTTACLSYLSRLRLGLCVKIIEIFCVV